MSLITKDIDGWEFIETSQEINGLTPVYTAYYKKKLSNSRTEEFQVKIYKFINKSFAKEALNALSNIKGSGYVRERISNVIIFQYDLGNICWVSNNLLIKMGSSQRRGCGIYMDAYDLVVCHDSGLKYGVHAPRAVFNAYIDRYPSNGINS